MKLAEWFNLPKVVTNLLERIEKLEKELEELKHQVNV